MSQYELRLRFTAADDHQALRLAEAWSDTCHAEYGTTYQGVQRVILPVKNSVKDSTDDNR